MKNTDDILDQQAIYMRESSLFDMRRCRSGDCRVSLASVKLQDNRISSVVFNLQVESKIS